MSRRGWEGDSGEFLSPRIAKNKPPQYGFGQTIESDNPRISVLDPLPTRFAFAQAPMRRTLEGMVVVASGIPALVTRWSGLLRRAGIPFAVARTLNEVGVEAPDHLEIWVEKDDREKARAVIIKAENGDRSPLE